MGLIPHESRDTIFRGWQTEFLLVDSIEKCSDHVSWKIKSIAWQLMSSLSSTLTLNFLFAPWRLGFWNVAFRKVWWFVMDLEKWLMVNFGWIFNQHGCFSVNLSGSHFRLASSNALFRGNNLATPHVKCESWGWHFIVKTGPSSLKNHDLRWLEQSASTRYYLLSWKKIIKFSSWWFFTNQLEKNMRKSSWVHLPFFGGWKLKTFLKTPPSFSIPVHIY